MTAHRYKKTTSMLLVFLFVNFSINGSWFTSAYDFFKNSSVAAVTVAACSILGSYYLYQYNRPLNRKIRKLRKIRKTKPGFSFRYDKEVQDAFDSLLPEIRALTKAPKIQKIEEIAKIIERRFTIDQNYSARAGQSVLAQSVSTYPISCIRILLEHERITTGDNGCTEIIEHIFMRNNEEEQSDLLKEYVEKYSSYSGEEWFLSPDLISSLVFQGRELDKGRLGVIVPHVQPRRPFGDYRYKPLFFDLMDRKKFAILKDIRDLLPENAHFYAERDEEQSPEQYAKNNGIDWANCCLQEN